MLAGENVVKNVAAQLHEQHILGFKMGVESASVDSGLFHHVSGQSVHDLLCHSGEGLDSGSG